jgi:dihydrofolate reductase
LRDVVYFASISIDGYLGAEDADDAWVVPDPELHRHFNNLEGSFDTHLYGRRMYELMAKSRRRVDWNSRLFGGNALEEVARLKREPGKSMSIGGAALATSLAQKGLIDEFRFSVMPTIVGLGTPIFHSLTRHINLTTLEVHQFSARAVLLRYRMQSAAATLNGHH